MNPRDSWRHTRFARQLGQTVPDSRYACAIEGPRPGRIRDALCWAAAWTLLVAAATLPYFW